MHIHVQCMYLLSLTGLTGQIYFVFIMKCKGLAFLFLRHFGTCMYLVHYLKKGKAWLKIYTPKCSH